MRRRYLVWNLKLENSLRVSYAISERLGERTEIIPDRQRLGWRWLTLQTLFSMLVGFEWRADSVQCRTYVLEQKLSRPGGKCSNREYDEAPETCNSSVYTVGKVWLGSLLPLILSHLLWWLIIVNERNVFFSIHGGQKDRTSSLVVLCLDPQDNRKHAVLSESQLSRKYTHPTLKKTQL